MEAEPVRRALGEAVRAIEARADVELVVTMREASAAYLHVELACALVAMIAALAFVVYAPWDVSDDGLFLFPVATALAVGLASWRVAPLRRALTPRRVRRRAVELGAKAAFFDKTVGLTRRHNGILVYLSRLERDAAIEADQRVRAVDGWPALAAEVERALGRARDAGELAAALRRLEAPLARALPRGADVANELPDDVEVAS